MKAILTWMVLCSPWLAIAQGGSAVRIPQKVTFLRIEESAYLAEKRHYTVSGDSLIIKDLSWGATDTLFTRKLTSIERDWLLAPFDQKYLSSIRNEYWASSTNNHEWTYHIVIYKGEFLRATDIHKAKVSFFYTFAHRLNQMVPKPYQLHYNTEYFKQY